MLKYLYQKIHKPKRVLFYRDLTAYSGGHQKVADYYKHLQSSVNFLPEISFSTRTCWNESNPWFPVYQFQSVPFNPADYDVVFLAGMDWQVYAPFMDYLDKPVINLIQGVRHGNPEADVHQYLSHKAIRICVSKPVEEAILATGRVNGPVFTIPNGHGLPDLPKTLKKWDLVIVGAKQPALAQELYNALDKRGINMCLRDQQVHRFELYESMNLSRIAVLLPLDVEGFYLPALEAMKYCDLVIVPDCIGNRDFCTDNQNCLMPQYNMESILASVEKGLEMLKNQHVLTVFKREMGETLRVHTLANERKAFLALMADVKRLWSM